MCGGATFRDGGTAVGVPVAVGAEGEAVGGAARSGGLGAAVLAGERADMLACQGVGDVDVAVAREAEPGGVGTAVEHRGRLAAVVARRPIRPLLVQHFPPRSLELLPRTQLPEEPREIVPLLLHPSCCSSPSTPSGSLSRGD